MGRISAPNKTRHETRKWRKRLARRRRKKKLHNLAKHRLKFRAALKPQGRIVDLRPPEHPIKIAGRTHPNSWGLHFAFGKAHADIRGRHVWAEEGWFLRSFSLGLLTFWWAKRL